MLKKNTTYSNYIYLFFFESTKHNFDKHICEISDLKKKKRHVIQLVLFDMLHLVKIVNHIKGYPANGQTTHTNSRNSRKNKILLNYRVNQFFFLFGRHKRNIFPTLIKAEYINRLWATTWLYEWLQAKLFVHRLANPKTNILPFDPLKLSKGQVNGFIRVGNAAKLGKSKKITKQCTIGLPLLFTKYIYMENLPIIFPYRLTIADDTRKKMGKKRKKNKKK